MNVEKFVKLLAVMAAYFFTAIQQPDNVMVVTIIVTACLGAGYALKNYWVPSTSEQGKLNVKDWIFGLILAVVVAIPETIQTVVNNGVFEWMAFLKLVGATAFAYLFPTFYQGKTKGNIVDPTPPPPPPTK